LPLASLLGIRKTDLAHRSCSFAGSVLHARNVLLIRCSLDAAALPAPLALAHGAQGQLPLDPSPQGRVMRRPVPP
ncbi:hypothetical protein ACSFA8_25130, partial [Variovorax sp. RT4R15]|uniref:hypothetical protein n=1 Tax=Variovorax sp. RT4R15 TaxID=3443737 RepID=UPI003F4898B6